MSAQVRRSVVLTISGLLCACYAVFACLISGPSTFAVAVVVVSATAAAMLCSLAAANLIEIVPDEGEDLFDVEQEWTRSATWLVVSVLCAGGLSLLVSSYPSVLPVGASAWLVPSLFWFTALPALVAVVGLRRAMVQMR